MNIQATKLALIKMIADIQSEQLLKQLFQHIKKESSITVAEESATNYQTSKTSRGKIHTLAAPPLEKIAIQKLKNEQNYQAEKVNALGGQWFQEDDYYELLKLLS